MILADTSIWVDHLHDGDARMTGLLDAGRIIMHPQVIGEIALGNLRNRDRILESLSAMPQAMAAESEEVVVLIKRHRLFGTGLGLVDVHLLASTLLTDAQLWTRDRRLKEAAERLGVGWEPAP